MNNGGKIMIDTELLEAIGGLLDKKLEPIKTDIAEIKNDIEDIKEHIEDIETSVGAITDWIDKAAEVNKVPFLKAL